jgi:ubiquinone/menaquinone biosynthesis C-methylase UbiE
MNEPETSDRYATEWKLAGQVESEWGDVLLGEFLEAHIPAAKRLGVTAYLAGPRYHRAAAQWVASALAKHAPPASSVDIGGGLGRFLVELLRQFTSLAAATYVEPSPTLFRWTHAAFSPGATIEGVPFLKGETQVDWHETVTALGLEAALLRKVRLIHGSADAPTLGDAQFDLVSVLNVFDQCAYPSLLAARALRLVAPSGYVCFSCTHLFQQRIFIDPATVFASLHDLFSATEWALIAETELPFAFRTGERHRSLFLSHHVLYQRVA